MSPKFFQISPGLRLTINPLPGFFTQKPLTVTGEKPIAGI